MKTSIRILKETQHRPFPCPTGKWAYYQEWNKAVFLHYEVPLSALEKFVPQQFEIDTFQGKAYISLVAFTMQKIRPRLLPAVKPISDFDEINIRTYIRNDGKPGVYFLSMEAGKTISAQIAKAFSGLPYEKAAMFRTAEKYISSHLGKRFFFEANYTIGSVKEPKTELDDWLTERYCLYLDRKNRCYRYDVHHLPWRIQTIKFANLAVDYRLGDIQLTSDYNLCHYAEGVKVLAWPRVELTDI